MFVWLWVSVFVCVCVILCMCVCVCVHACVCQSHQKLWHTSQQLPTHQLVFPCTEHKCSPGKFLQFLTFVRVLVSIKLHNWVGINCINCVSVLPLCNSVYWYHVFVANDYSHPSNHCSKVCIVTFSPAIWSYGHGYITIHYHKWNLVIHGCSINMPLLF